MINSEFIQTFPLIQTPPNMNFLEILQALRHLSVRYAGSILPTDCRECGRGRPPSSLTRSTWPALGRFLHRRTRNKNVFR